MVLSASNNQLWFKMTVRSYALSFGHSDPDPTSVDPYSIIPFGKSAVLRISIMTGICELLSYTIKNFYKVGEFLFSSRYLWIGSFF